jgi:hypothetical protein
MKERLSESSSALTSADYAQPVVLFVSIDS